jgi:outer membrane receptor protein involved in Fe transport
MACGLLAPSAWAQSGTEPLTLPGVEVVRTTLLPGLGTPMQDVPANVQIYGSEDLRRQRSSHLADFLESNATSVSVNAAQGNAFQPDVSFRGFTASPLLGLPQGLSVFQDGVRVNEPFGDVVNWDLIPQSAIASLQLLPGSQPGFGLNTLGGALSVQTKSGLSHPGGALEVQGGSFGRRSFEIEHGGDAADWNYFFTANRLQDHGWAEHNPSLVQQFFGKLGYVAGQSSVDLSLTLADNTLEGTQTLPQSFAGDFRQAYTYPDINKNSLGFLGVKGSHLIDDHFFLDGNLYFRKYRNQNTSSNVNGEYDAVSNLVQANNDRSAIDQSSYGAGLQLTYLGDIAGKKQQLVVGISADLGSAQFIQEAQDASFTASRNTVGTNDYALSTDATAGNRYLGLFVNDTVTLDERWALTLSGRYNRASITIRDQTGVTPELNGDHGFAHLSPALGINFNPGANVTAYATYNQGMRTPTPIELTCADRLAPCKLPNNFLSDPALNMVLAKTFEMGLRGHRGRSFKWSAALYRTQLQDDIQFISSLGAGSNGGYFQNVGRALRQGVELAVSERWGSVQTSLHYGFVDATYQSSFTMNSPANSSADAAGNIQVRPGNQIPGLPRQTLKLRLDYDLGASGSVGLAVNASAGQYARGNENNQSANGWVAGFTVMNIDARLLIARDLEVVAQISNVLDRRYNNFGVLGRNVFTGPDNTFDGLNPRNEMFLGHGAPRGMWIGLRYNWS